MDDTALDHDAALKAEARALAEAGQTDDAIRAWQGILARSAGGREAHKRLAGLLVAAGRPAEAVPHIRALLEHNPDAAWLWETLARALDRAGDADGAIEAWRQVLGRAPDPSRAVDALARLLRARGAVEDLRRLVRLSPDDLAAALALADALEDAGRADEALEALDAFLALRPSSILAQERRDRLSHARRRRGEASLTIAVAGNCQAIGVAQSLRRLLPGAEVAVALVSQQTPPDRAEELLASCAGADIVVGQGFRDPGHPLGAARLEALGGRAVAIPLMAFTGFHPDIFYAPHEADIRPFHRHHSRIIAAAFARGVPQGEVRDLFNGYVYAALGYFDEFEKAERYLASSSPDLDLGGLLDRWRGQVFAHTPKHPTQGFLHGIAEAACVKAGLPAIQADAGPDHQALGPIWPIYPQIARRLGVEGSMTFRPGKGAPAMELDELVAHFYRLYRDRAAAALLDPEVERAAGILEREGV